MEPRRIRLGDVIDDYCPRCRLIMNHGVVGMVGGDVKKVRCNTCLSEHQFRHGRLPKRRKDERGRLFEEVLKGLAAPGAAGVPSSSRATASEESEPKASSVESGGEAAGAPGAGSEESGMAAGSNPAPAEGEAGTPEPAAGASHPHHRRLYTIRRSIADGKATGRGPKKP